MLEGLPREVSSVARGRVLDTSDIPDAAPRLSSPWQGRLFLSQPLRVPTAVLPSPWQPPQAARLSARVYAEHRASQRSHTAPGCPGAPAPLAPPLLPHPASLSRRGPGSSALRLTLGSVLSPDPQLDPLRSPASTKQLAWAPSRSSVSVG